MPCHASCYRQTHQPPTFEYAVDETYMCTWLMDAKMMAYMARVVQGPGNSMAR